MSYYPKDPLDMDPEDVMPDTMRAPLVGVTKHGEFCYYAAPRVLWYLDYQKKFQESGVTSPTVIEETLRHRFGIMTVDADHEEAYIAGLEPYKRSCDELRDGMRMCVEACELDDFGISLLIDFDEKRLISYYPEPFFFEEYVPDGWTSEYRPLRGDEIPPDKHFWMDEDNKNMFDELFKEEV